MNNLSRDRDRLARPYIVVLSCLVVLGAALRLYRLDTGLWFDEIMTLIASVRPPLGQILTHFPGNNDHPLYSVLAHMSVVAFGEHPWSIRLPSAIFGIAAIPMLYVAGTAVTSRMEALLATSILTVSYHHIWFSQNARGYTALVFFVLLSTFLLQRWLRQGGKANLTAYAVVIALGSYAHLTMVFVCFCQAAICALALFRRRGSGIGTQEWKHAAFAFVGAGILTSLFYAPMLLDVHAFFTTNTVSSNEVATPFWALLAAVRGLHVGFGTFWGIAIGGLIFAAGVWSYFKQNDIIVYFFLLPVPVTLALAIAMGRPVFPRFVFFSIGFALLITVRGAAAMGTWASQRIGGRLAHASAGRLLAILLTVAAIAFSFRSLPYGYRYPKQDYDRAVEFVEESMQEGDLVVVVGDTGAVPVLDYLGRPWRRIDRSDQLHDLQKLGREIWVIYTFQAYIAANEPKLWGMLQGECKEVGEFDGTVAGGAINVSRCLPRVAGTLR